MGMGSVPPPSMVRIASDSSGVNIRGSMIPRVAESQQVGGGYPVGGRDSRGEVRQLSEQESSLLIIDVPFQNL